MTRLVTPAWWIWHPTAIRKQKCKRKSKVPCLELIQQSVAGVNDSGFGFTAGTIALVDRRSQSGDVRCIDVPETIGSALAHYSVGLAHVRKLCLQVSSCVNMVRAGVAAFWRCTSSKSLSGGNHATISAGTPPSGNVSALCIASLMQTF